MALKEVLEVQVVTEVKVEAMTAKHPETEVEVAIKASKLLPPHSVL
jgi:hypothetical protein